MSIRLRLTLVPGLVLAALALGALPSSSEAQFGKRLKDAVKRTAEDKAIQKATETEGKKIDDAIEGGADAKPDTAAETGPPPTAGAADAAVGRRKCCPSGSRSSSISSPTTAPATGGRSC